MIQKQSNTNTINSIILFGVDLKKSLEFTDEVIYANGNIPTILYLNVDTNEVSWLDDTPIDFRSLGIIKWNHRNYLNESEIIQLKVGHSFARPQKKNVPKTKSKYPISLLKSGLQKSVRRNLTETGLRIATQIMTGYEKGVFELLRRLTIIMIEDSVLNFDYMLLIWFLAAISLGYECGQTQYNIILKITNTILETLVQDHKYHVISLKKTLSLETVIHSISKTKYRDLLWCLVLRKSFGCMPSEMVMIDKMIMTWGHRIHQNSNLLTLLEYDSLESPEITDYLDFSGQYIPLEAVDQHCSGIARVLSEQFGIDEDVVSGIIWDYRSSISKRPEIEPFNIVKKNEIYHDLWKKIAPFVELEAKKIMERFE